LVGGGPAVQDVLHVHLYVQFPVIVLWFLYVLVAKSAPTQREYKVDKQTSQVHAQRTNQQARTANRKLRHDRVKRVGRMGNGPLASVKDRKDRKGSNL
jgi:amino acid permease